MSLESLGWNAHWEERFSTHRAHALEPARVSGQDRERYVVIDSGGTESAAEVTGRFRHEADSSADYPAVGDWVALRPCELDGPRSIVAVLPRAGAFVRKRAGEVTEPQVVAANVDTVFVIAGLDGDFNPRRIERFLATAWDGGAAPVLVLNKADLVDDLGASLEEATACAPGVPVVAVSAAESRGLEALVPWLESGRTVALLGSSGVGKSTLANALLGEERQSTGAVREADSRGRHTTTRRELLALPGGAWLLDTPGVRELQLWADESSLGDSFPEIAALAAACRFHDCRHQSEPGCAVLEAERDGSLPGERLASWRKLQREMRWIATRQDQRLRAEEHAKWKAIHRAQRQHTKRNPKR